MKSIVRLACVLIVIFTVSGCGPNQQEKLMQSFIDSRLEQIKQLSKESAIAYWNATTTGDEQEYEKYSERELKLRQKFSNREDYKQLQ